MRLKKILELGFEHTEEPLIKKEIYLVNAVSMTYLCALFFIVLLGLFFDKRFVAQETLAGYFVFLIIILSIPFLQLKGFFVVSKWLITIIPFMNGYLFDMYLLPGIGVRFYYIVPTLFSLVLFKEGWVSYFLLFISLLLFYDFFGIFNNTDFSPASIHFINYFIMIFLVVRHFVFLNKKSEKRLSEDKSLIQEQKNRLEELQEFQQHFFVNVSHEIRTPLTLIKGNVNRLKNSAETNVIKQQSEKIEHIVNDVLDLARLDTDSFKLNKKEVSIVSVVQKLILSFNAYFEDRGIQLEFKNEALSVIGVYVDSVFVERSINNILSNALKYTPKGGCVTLVVYTSGNEVFIDITDTGIGIAVENHQKIFERFYQVDNSINKAGGSGVGLAFTKEIITLHKGTIQLDSEIGKGSTFKIALPLIRVLTNDSFCQPSVQTVSPETVCPDTRKQHILLVEDNKDMRDYIKSIMLDYVVTEAVDGREAIEKLGKQVIDFIVTDYMMPNMDGYEFVKRIKELQYNIPILMLTAKSEHITKMALLRIGIDDFITKPFDEEELLLRIKNSLSNKDSREVYREKEQIINEDKDLPFLTEVTNYIKEFCGEPTFGVDNICVEFGLSKSSLYRKVKSLTGLSASSIITEIRLKKAYEIKHKNSNIDIKELALEVGYINYNYFKKLYKNRFGERSLLG